MYCRAVDILRLSAFTTDPAGGNPAGVVIAQEMPTAEEMLRIAREIGYSESAFIALPEGDRSVRVRYFSPLAEVPFCGHATIAGGVALAERMGTGDFTLTTNSGEVGVETSRTHDGLLTATLTSVAPHVEAAADDLLRPALRALGWGEDMLDADLPPSLAFAGAWHLIVPLARRRTLEAMAYDFDALKAIMLEHDLTTVQIVWRQAPDRFRARNPFPVGGMVEDPATGAAAAALGAYLRARGEIRPPAAFTIDQGEEMGRPSTLLVEVVPRRPGVRVTGTAVAL